MAVKWRDRYKGDLSPWWFWQLCFCSVWGRCPAEREEQTPRCAQLSTQLSAELCSPDRRRFHTTVRCTESIHCLWLLNRKFSGLLVRPWIASAVASCGLYSIACGHPCCLCTFSYLISSFESTLHLICFDTALLEQPPLSVMTLCDLPSLWRVSMIAKSAVFPIIVVSENKRYPEFILYGWSFIKPKIKYSNILKYWFLTFISSKL